MYKSFNREVAQFSNKELLFEPKLSFHLSTDVYWLWGLE